MPTASKVPAWHFWNTRFPGSGDRPVNTLPGLRFPRPPFRWSRSTLHKEARRSRARPRARRGQRDHDLRPQYPLPKWRRSRVVAGQSLMRRARPVHQTPSVCTFTTKKDHARSIGDAIRGGEVAPLPSPVARLRLRRRSRRRWLRPGDGELGARRIDWHIGYWWSYVAYCCRSGGGIARISAGEGVSSSRGP